MCLKKEERVAFTKHFCCLTLSSFHGCSAFRFCLNTFPHMCLCAQCYGFAEFALPGPCAAAKRELEQQQKKVCVGKASRGRKKGRSLYNERTCSGSLLHETSRAKSYSARLLSQTRCPGCVTHNAYPSITHQHIVHPQHAQSSITKCGSTTTIKHLA